MLENLTKNIFRQIIFDKVKLIGIGGYYFMEWGGI